ncbi:hypothetical protein ACQKDD_05525 [Planococcus kocurii]|uniref:Uncharacterized protein n=1 Tax=Planococcus kocurii TaxID=1374 RepID=A0ABN4JVK1_9BACL|nr:MULTISPECIES: hypothetical protein [Planococcus]ALS77456.1 hypothetical protein AUO94_01830 [Planococcus kocurii]KAA0959161.1 hypothetical protein FQ085_05430 [Planococcus sp. ANT_H30]
METDTDSLVTFLIAFGVPIAMMTWAYFKMNATDQQSVKSDFTSPKFLVSMGSFALGAFLIEFSDTFAVPMIKTMGLVLLIIGGIGSSIVTWKASKVRSLLILGLFALMVFFHVS